MIRANPNYSKIQANYLFAEIAARVKACQAEKPSARLIRLGIGDVTQPLPAACVEALERASAEMGAAETFRGYGPDYGYAFLREAIAKNDFETRGCDISPDEIFVSDGAKCDTGNFQEMFDSSARIAVPDPVYPVYVDSNVMAGRTGAAAKSGRYEGIVYLECNEENGFVPAPPKTPADVAYLCFPNNPTGAVASREQLAAWVEWARTNDALILFDAAYEAFIREEGVPHSIYEIPGAKEVAVEFRSFSKTAGFTGTRCGYCVVPAQCRAFDSAGARIPLQTLWKRRQSTKFNGVAYPVQRAAEAALSAEGRAQCKALVDGYLANAAIVASRLERHGLKCTGAKNSPYVWFDCGMDSWEFFDKVLRNAEVVVTPGVGFGSNGAGFIRISAFNSRENVEEAMDRIEKILG
ncbi:MAG: LL-diaminopimelate aminotransferase [Kiritimatiellae bacterium]|nr:LL-diaminopimelate aminotransferase [Kiritimatiellia bacterium]